jgi:hypothetical protein
LAPPDRPPGPDVFDADLSAVRNAADNLGRWLAIWVARTEPAAHARRCASDAVKTIAEAAAALHRIRARVLTETHQADLASAARADKLLARMSGARYG